MESTIFPDDLENPLRQTDLPLVDADNIMIELLFESKSGVQLFPAKKCTEVT